jgi:hypothetical protein
MDTRIKTFGCAVPHGWAHSSIQICVYYFVHCIDRYVLYFIDKYIKKKQKKNCSWRIVPCVKKKQEKCFLGATFVKLFCFVL